MKHTNITVLSAVLLWFYCPSSHAQGSAFNYSAELTAKGIPAHGSFDMEFRLYDLPAAGSQIGPTLLFDSVRIHKKRFALLLDFGSEPFNGDARWLEVAVRAASKKDDFTVLKPRQQFRPVPYAIHAGSATRLTGPIDPRQLPDATESSKGVVQIGTGLAVTEGVVSVAYGTNSGTAVEGNDPRLVNDWNLNGNSGTIPATNFLGTRDNQPLEFRVNNARALRLEPNATAPNIIAGSSANVIAPGVIGASISGGYSNVIAAGAHYATIPGGFGAMARVYGQRAYANGSFASPGDAQAGLYVLRGTSNGQDVELFLDGVSQRLTMPTNSAWWVDMSAIGSDPTGNTTAIGFQRAFFLRQGNILRLLEREQSGRVSMEADNAVSAFRVITGLGPDVPPMRWVAVIRTVEVKF